MVKKKRPDELSEARDEKAYLHGWLRGVIDGLKNVDDETATKLLKKCGEMCARSWIKMVGLDRKKYDLDSFIAKLNEIPGPSSWKKEGNTIYEEITGGKCVCPLVTWGVIEPNSRMCLVCCPSWSKTLFRDITGLSKMFKLVDSVARGGDKCIMYHYILPAKARPRKKIKSRSEACKS